MERMTPARRLVVGRDVRLLSATSATTMVVESEVRVSPGLTVELVGDERRMVMVESWHVARLGQNGPTFHGICRFVPTGGGAR